MPDHHGAVSLIDPGIPGLRLLGPIEAVPDEAALAAARLLPGRPLPPSYRAFAARYGYGLLCNLFLIFMPMPGYGCDELIARSRELAAFFASGVDEEWFEYEPDGSPELVRRLVPFGISENGHYLAWDPADCDERGEAAVYVVGAKFLAVRRAAADLREFIAGCLDQRVKAMLGPGYDPLPATFRPAIRS